MVPHDDILLLQLLRCESREAFEQLYKKYYKTLMIEAYYLLKDEMEAEDTVQVLFIDFWERRLFDSINTSLKGYLQTAVRHRCFKKLAKEQRKQEQISQYNNSLQLVDEAFQETTPRFAINDHLLLDMPAQRLQAFTLVHYENKPYKTAASEMGISINSLKTHLKLAVKSLKTKIKKSNP